VEAENKPAHEPKPSAETEHNVGKPSVETLRAKLDAAIVAERWDAVAAIRTRITEVEREGVVDLGRERARRRG
jgi:hypothetical protein